MRQRRHMPRAHTHSRTEQGGGLEDEEEEENNEHAVSALRTRTRSRSLAPPRRLPPSAPAGPLPAGLE